ncbi:MAG: hypothetical protein NZ733_02415 [Aigarchaeota archaeon]|nr:hypothetical protein [Aigarchaeota archaeon]
MLGLKARVLFSRHGYAPHFAENLVDPVTGEEVLVMADPHIRRSALIYSLESGEVVWEHRVGGRAVTANPHIVRMVTEEIPEIGAQPGDVICADLDNNYVLVPRKGRNVRLIARPSDAKWSHDCLPTSDLKGLIITDYSAGFVRRIGFEGNTVWNLKLGPGVAKLSRVEGRTPSGIHGNDFGGDLLVAVNGSREGVFEVREKDGSVVWSCPPDSTKNVFWPMKPHSALRLGLAELGGNVTVIGMEAGGGVVAVDEDCRPVWGWMRPFFALGDKHRRWGSREVYRPTSVGLHETTHVFWTLRGRLGLIDWNGRYSSTVLELEELPRSSLFWALAFRDEVGPEGTFLDPPINAMEWEEVALNLLVHGGEVELTVYGTFSPYADVESKDVWFRAESVTAGEGESRVLRFSNLSAIRVHARSITPNSKYSVFVAQRP